MFFCEIKFFRSEIRTNVISDMKEKIKRATIPRGMAVCPVLIHMNGVEDGVVDAQYFTEIINFASFL